MDTHLYLSLVPEALIASMLDPEAFGTYYAVGTMKKAHGQAMFVEVDPAFRDPFFRIDDGMKRCVPHANGNPKRSVYISVYRVAEHVPVSALGSLYLVTHDGRVAELKKETPPVDHAAGLYLYQEICPVNPLVASTKNPIQFHRFMSEPSESVFALPALYFAELKLGGLAVDPERGDGGELPYGNLDHLRQCLVDIRTKQISTKMVDRNHPVAFPYRTVQTGFYFGHGQELAFYPMPAKDELLSRYYAWWRSAQM
ncbi:MAG: hypothetical protein PHV28_04765 [Kiritimatiellae bacterium]|nr:hypothetical protein [Kiritimatiellia bacterium]